MVSEPYRTRVCRSRRARRGVRSIAAAVGMLACTTLAPGLGIRPGSEIPIPDADFEQGLGTWSQASGAGGPDRVSVVSSPMGPGHSARFEVQGSETAWAWNTATSVTCFPVPEVTELGWRLEGRSRVFVPASTSWGAGDEAWIEVSSVEGTTGSTIARSPGLGLASAPRNRWIDLCTDPEHGHLGGRILPGATGVTVSLWVRGSGVVYFDDVRCGRYEATGFDPPNPGFETPGLQGWSVLAGDARGSFGLDPSDPPFRGRGHAVLSGSMGTVIEARLPATPPGLGPRGGSRLAAGAWVLPRTSISAPLSRAAPTAPGPRGIPPSGPRPAAAAKTSRPGHRSLHQGAAPKRPLATGTVASNFVLQLIAWNEANPTDPGTILAERSWNPDTSDLDRWHWIETEATTALPLPFDATAVGLRIHARFPGEFAIDSIQVGEAPGVVGLPRRLAICNYVARYRSPHFIDGGSPISAGEAWRAWRGLAGPHCDPSHPGWNHDPACSTAPSSCLRSNGRRDLAIGTTDGIDELPLIGGYDSRDPHVVALHLNWIEASGFDAIAFESLGHTLAEERRAAGLVALNEEALDVVFDLLEKPEHDLELLLHYEPKVHFNGWIQGESSFAERIQGLTEDLVDYVERYGRRKGALRRNGELVVFVFGPGQCIEIGGQTLCLTDAWWKLILDDVAALTGERLCLLGDHVPTDLDFVQGPPWYAQAFEGMLHWDLAPLNLLRHRTYADALSGSPTWPAPTAQEFDQHLAASHRGPEQWRRRLDSSRLSIGVVWPGFDDSGVAGWGAENGLGEDGTPLCIRIADDFGGTFLSRSFDRLEASDLDVWMVTTWNDWNERTQIEPRWNPEYVDAVLAGTPPPPTSIDAALERLLEVQARIHGWKGSQADPQLLDQLARDYLLDAHGSPGVSRYR